MCVFVKLQLKAKSHESGWRLKTPRQEAMIKEQNMELLKNAIQFI